MAKDDVKLNKNALAGKRGATATLTPHVCPNCAERVRENELLVVMHFVDGKRRMTRGYHRNCYRLAS
jgi:hypothetical protein